MTWAFKEAEAGKWKADVWRNGTWTSDSQRALFVIVQVGLNCIQGIVWGLYILEILAIQHSVFHSCVHDLNKFRYTKY